jgi:hypothetical protein
MESYSTEKLLNVLSILQEEIKKGTIPKKVEQDLWNYLTWDKNTPGNKEMIKYLFAGWWGYNNKSTRTKA